MKTLQFLIDNICADFTVESLLGVVKARVAKGPCTVGDIAGAIVRRDPSLDARCAEGLAQGAVNFLADRGDVEVKGTKVTAVSSSAGVK